MAVGNNVIKLRSGNWFDYDSPETNTVEIQDIAHGLSFICRYGAQCPSFYSVASHSILVSLILKHVGEPVEVQFQGLMHDATEAVMGDMVTPLKRKFPEYKALESQVIKNIGETHGFDPEFGFNIDNADKIALAIEKWAFWPNSEPWQILINYGIETVDGHLDPFWVEFMETEAVANLLHREGMYAYSSFIEHYQAISAAVKMNSQ